MRTPIRTTAGVLFAVLALVATACGDDDTATPTTETTQAADVQPEAEGAFPVSVPSGDSEVTIEARPESIVSLSPTATEMLFAIGAGDQVVAADDFSNFPEEAPTTELSGFDPNLEAIVDLDPDLVLVQNDANDVVAGLESVGVPTLILPAASSLDDSYAQIELLGAATGRIGDAAELVGQMQSDIADLVATIPEDAEPVTYYHELDDTLFTVTSSTFIGEIYALAGMENIADPADADGASGGYPQLSAEVLVDADPDVIFLADTKCCGQDAETVAARPGFADLSAVRAGNIVELDDDIASRWGPRVVDFLRQIVDARSSIETPVG